MRLGIARVEPAVVVGARLVAVIAHQRDMIEAVERRLHVRVRAWSSIAGVSCSYFGSSRWSRSDWRSAGDGSWKPWRGGGRLMIGSWPVKFCKWLLPTSAVGNRRHASRSTKVTASIDSGMPLERTSCTDGIRPVIRLARLGWHTGLAT